MDRINSWLIKLPRHWKLLFIGWTVHFVAKSMFAISADLSFNGVGWAGWVDGAGFLMVFLILFIGDRALLQEGRA